MTIIFEQMIRWCGAIHFTNWNNCFFSLVKFFTMKCILQENKTSSILYSMIAANRIKFNEMISKWLHWLTKPKQIQMWIALTQRNRESESTRMWRIDWLDYSFNNNNKYIQNMRKPIIFNSIKKLWNKVHFASCPLLLLLSFSLHLFNSVSLPSLICVLTLIRSTMCICILCTQYFFPTRVQCVISAFAADVCINPHRIGIWLAFGYGKNINLNKQAISWTHL